MLTKPSTRRIDIDTTPDENFQIKSIIKMKKYAVLVTDAAHSHHVAHLHSMLCVYTAPQRPFSRRWCFLTPCSSRDVVVPWTNALAKSPAPFSIYGHVYIEAACFWLLL